MVPDANLEIPHAGGKVVPAGRGVGVVEPQRFPKVGQPVAGDGPVGNVVVNLLGIHVVDVLQILLSAQHRAGAVELSRLEDDLPDGVVPPVFADARPDPVHYYRRDGPHAIVALAAGLALNQPCKKLKLRHLSHLHAKNYVPFPPDRREKGKSYNSGGLQPAPERAIMGRNESMEVPIMLKRMLCLLLCLLTCLPVLAEEPAVEAQTQESITLSFIGDCSIGDSIQYRDYSTCYHATLAEKGYAWPFSLVKDVLAADDLTVANLEVVLTTRSKGRTDRTFNMIGKPEFVQVLKEGSVEVVNTANNHAWDFGADAYHEMLGYLDEAEIPHFGTIYPGTKSGTDLYPIVEVKGVKIGFVSFTYPQEDDKKRIATRITKLREQGAQLVVVSLHWGREEQPQPTSGQPSYARACIDAGADLVYGHHAHVLQSVQFYKGKPIFYSTGNFTFGTMSQVDPDTGIFQLTYDVVDGEPVLRRFSVVPCRTQGSGDYRPYILTDENEILKMRKKLVYPKEVKNMTTVTEFFLQNGYMDFEDGIAVGE